MNRTGIGKQMREIAAKRAAKRNGGKQMVRVKIFSQGFPV